LTLRGVLIAVALLVVLEELTKRSPSATAGSSSPARGVVSDTVAYVTAALHVVGPSLRTGLNKLGMLDYRHGFHDGGGHFNHSILPGKENPLAPAPATVYSPAYSGGGSYSGGGGYGGGADIIGLGDVGPSGGNMG